MVCTEQIWIFHHCGRNKVELNIISSQSLWDICTNHFKKLKIVRTFHCGGIGAAGSAFEQYFHPSQHICDAHPNDWKTIW